jgi:hypothetical protein
MRSESNEPLNAVEFRKARGMSSTMMQLAILVNKEQTMFWIETSIAGQFNNRTNGKMEGDHRMLKTPLKSNL